jgi:hypothetical protein
VARKGGRARLALARACAEAYVQATRTPDPESAVGRLCREHDATTLRAMLHALCRPASHPNR